MALNLHDWKSMHNSMVSETVVGIPVLTRQALIKGLEYKEKRTMILKINKI
jgi:hypothetical protein